MSRVGMMLPLRAAQRVSSRTAAPVMRRYASSHGPSYNEPSGYLFGEKPPAPGTKRVRQAWELPWYLGIYGGIAAFAAVMWFKPDRSVKQWLGPEAERRLDEAGLPWRYKPSANSDYPNGIP